MTLPSTRSCRLARQHGYLSAIIGYEEEDNPFNLCPHIDGTIDDHESWNEGFRRALSQLYPKQVQSDMAAATAQ